MPRTPRPLTSALAAALAAGTVVAVSAVAEPGTDRPAQATAPKGWRMAPPPTRAEAIRDASVAREDQERDLAKALGIEQGRVRAAARAVVAKRLSEEVVAERLTQAQRDALLACFDDPVGCDRSGLPATRTPGGAQLPYGTGPLGAEFAGPLTLPVPRVAPPSREARRRARDRARARAKARRRQGRARPVPSRPMTMVARPDAELARELGVSREALARALRDIARRGATRPPRLDPDGVPLGLPSLPFSLVVAPPPSRPAPAPPTVPTPVPRPALPAPARPLMRPTPPPARPVPAPPRPARAPAVPAPAPAAPAPAAPATPAPEPLSAPAPVPTTP